MYFGVYEEWFKNKSIPFSLRRGQVGYTLGHEGTGLKHTGSLSLALLYAFALIMKSLQ